MNLVEQEFGLLKVIRFSHTVNGQKVWECCCKCGKLTYVTSGNLNNGSTQSCGCLRKKQYPDECLIGRKFNKLTVITLHNEKSKDGRFIWECVCECGSNEVVLASSRDLKNSRKKSCSCSYKKKQKIPIDLTGKMFGRLLVLRVHNKRGANNQILWESKCDCGKIVTVTTRNLKSGVTRSCGCLKENPVSPYKTDEIFQSLLRVWTGIKKRCSNSNYEHFNNYGGRGISVCNEWKSFAPFYDWAINNGYNHGLQIDRIDVNGNYEPLNCRWVTPKENSRNKSNNRKVMYNGILRTVSELSEISGLSKKTISDRLDREWSEEELLLPQRKRNNIRKYSGQTLIIGGESKAFKEWADIIGISYASLRDRVKAGWREDELLLPKGSKRGT